MDHIVRLNPRATCNTLSRPTLHKKISEIVYGKKIVKTDRKEKIKQMYENTQSKKQNTNTQIQNKGTQQSPNGIYL